MDGAASQTDAIGAFNHTGGFTHTRCQACGRGLRGIVKVPSLRYEPTAIQDSLRLLIGY